MKVAYASMTGNIKRFIRKLDGFDTVFVKKDVIIDEPFILITYTTGRGLIPKEVDAFLANNSDNLIAVIGSGNRNWGMNFCKGAHTISARYSVPVLHEFELSGNPSDAEKVSSIINELLREEDKRFEQMDRVKQRSKNQR